MTQEPTKQSIAEERVAEWRKLTPQQQLEELGLKDNPPRSIYLEQEQVELSACVIGANPNALARSYKAGLLTDADLDLLARAQPIPLSVPQPSPGLATTLADSVARSQRQQVFLERMHQIIKHT